MKRRHASDEIPAAAMRVMLGGGAPHRHLVCERIPPAELVVVVLLVIVVFTIAAKGRGRRCTATSSRSRIKTSAGLSRKHCYEGHAPLYSYKPEHLLHDGQSKTLLTCCCREARYSRRAGATWCARPQLPRGAAAAPPPRCAAAAGPCCRVRARAQVPDTVRRSSILLNKGVTPEFCSQKPDCKAACWQHERGFHHCSARCRESLEMLSQSIVLFAGPKLPESGSCYDTTESRTDLASCRARDASSSRCCCCRASSRAKLASRRSSSIAGGGGGGGGGPGSGRLWLSSLPRDCRCCEAWQTRQLCFAMPAQ